MTKKGFKFFIASKTSIFYTPTTSRIGGNVTNINFNGQHGDNYFYLNTESYTYTHDQRSQTLENSKKQLFLHQRDFFFF